MNNNNYSTEKTNHLANYTVLFIRALHSDNFVKYAELTYLMHRPEFQLLCEDIKKKAISYCHEHFIKYGYD